MGDLFAGRIPVVGRILFAGRIPVVGRILPVGRLAALGSGDLRRQRIRLAPELALPGFELGECRLRFVQPGLGGVDLAVEPGDLRVEARGVRQLEVLDVRTLVVPLGDQGVPLGLGGLPLLKQRRGIHPLAGLKRRELLLQRGLLLPEQRQVFGGLQHVGLLCVAHAVGGLQRRHRRGHLLPLLKQRVPLGGHLLNGGGDLLLALLQRVLGLFELLIGRGLAVGQLSPAVGELGLALVQLALHLGKLPVDLLQYSGVDHVDAALLDGHVDLLLDDAAGIGGRHAVQALEGRHQLVVDVVGQRQYVHVVACDGQYRHRQHVRVQLERHRCAHVVVPGALELVQLGGDLDQRRVHVRAVVELHDDHGHIVPGLGGHLLDIRERGEGGLHGPGDLPLHLLGRRAGILGVHHHVGQVHAGQQVGGHVLEGYVAQHDHQYDAHDHGIGLFDGRFRQHGATSRNRSYIQENDIISI